MRPDQVIEDLRETLCEAIFNHRWVLLEGYHLVGLKVHKMGLDIEKVAKYTNQMPKTIHYCVELYKKYPDLNSLPDGKNVSWYKITKTLPPYDRNHKKGKV